VVFEQTFSNRPRSRCRSGSVSPFRDPQPAAKRYCYVPSRTSIQTRGWSAWRAATARRCPGRNGGAWLVILPAEPGWWADTVGEHFSDWKAALAVLGELGFSDDAKDWPIARLSTGERLRLALVRALMVRPRVLLLDEPTAALDPASVRAVESLIAAQVRVGLAVLWVTHDLEQAKRVAVRRLVVNGGQVREEVSKETMQCPAISR
jgi:ABC-type dipeptide/oligopeptide/nickel transport system ATPase component